MEDLPNLSQSENTSKRVIRKVVLLEPSKIKQLRLRSKIIQAVSKLKDSAKADCSDDHNETVHVYRKPIANESDAPREFRVSGHDLTVDSSKGSSPESKSSVPINQDTNLHVERLQNYEENIIKKQVDILKKSANQAKFERTICNEFNGFTSLEISEELKHLKRFTNAVNNNIKTRRTISPFKHHGRPSSRGKYSNVRIPNKNSQLQLCATNTSTRVKNVIKNAILNKCSTDFPMKDSDTASVLPDFVERDSLSLEATQPGIISISEDCNAKSNQLTISDNENQEKKFLDDKHSDITLASCNQIGQSLDTANASNKGIIILEQRIIKSGSSLSMPLTFQDLAESSFQPVDSHYHQTSPLSFPAHQPSTLPAIKLEQTVSNKNVGSDSKSVDVQIGLQTLKKEDDPTKSICEIFVKKMMKPSCKRFFMNEYENESHYIDETTRETDALRRMNNRGQSKLFSVAKEIDRESSSLNEISITKTPKEKYLITPNFVPNLSDGSTSFVSHFPKLDNENTNDLHQHNGSCKTICGNEKLRCTQNVEPMDAVEYILHCSQNYSMGYAAQFEDENDDVFEEVDWGDDEEVDKEVISPTKFNSSDVKLNAERKHRNCNMILIEADDSVLNSDHNIERAEVAFEDDTKHSFQIMDFPVLKEFSPVGTDQHFANQTKGNIDKIPVGSDNILTAHILDEMTHPADEKCSDPQMNSLEQRAIQTEQTECIPPKKRKRTIFDYTNAVAPIAEISERIRRRMNSRLSTPLDIHKKIKADKSQGKREKKDVCGLKLYDKKREVDEFKEENYVQLEHKSEFDFKSQIRRSKFIPVICNRNRRSLMVPANASKSFNEECSQKEKYNQDAASEEIVEDSVQQASLQELEHSKLFIPNDTTNNSCKGMPPEAYAFNSISAKCDDTSDLKNSELELLVFDVNNESNTSDNIQSAVGILNKKDRIDKLNKNGVTNAVVNGPSIGPDSQCRLEIEQQKPEIVIQINEPNDPGVENKYQKSSRKRKPISKSDFVINDEFCRRTSSETRLKKPSCSNDFNLYLTSVSNHNTGRKDMILSSELVHIGEACGAEILKSDFRPRRKPGRPRKTLSPLTNSPKSKTATLKSVQEICIDENLSVANEKNTPKLKVKLNEAEKMNCPMESECNTTGVKKKGLFNDYNIHSKMLIVNSREEFRKVADEAVGNKENDEDIVKQEREVKGKSFRCGACKRLVCDATFKEHLKQHYGVGWRDGYEKPINMTSYREVLNAMTHYMQRYKVGYFTCKICGDTKRSAAGCLVHIQTCLLDKYQLDKLMQTCEFCSKMFLPPALWAHSKICSSNPEKHKKSIENALQLDHSGQKRKSAIRAASSFKAIMENSLQSAVDDLVKVYCTPRGPGLVVKWKNDIKKYGVTKCFEKSCPFESCDVNAMKTHAKNCVKIRRGGFSCARCQFYDVDESKVRSHVLEKHEKILQKDTTLGCEAVDESNDIFVADPDIDGTEESNAEEENEIKVAKVAQRVNPEQNFYSTTQTIFDQIYSEKLLYPDLRPPISFPPLSNSNFEANIKRSVRFGFTKEKKINSHVGATEAPLKWIQLVQGEVKITNDETFIFVGGPVTNCTWVPTPPSAREKHVYLAVSFKHGYNSRTMCLKPKEEDSLILVYKVDLLNSKNRNIAADILYGIKCRGPIHHIEFMPSGGFAPNINRLGLLAVATVKSSINIYALPLKAFEDKCFKIKDDQVHCRIVDLNPSLVLCIDLCHESKEIDGLTTQCLRISWSEAKEHNLIAAGFSNGYTGIWDIRNKDNLSKFCRDGVPCFVPLSYFNAIPHAVSGMALHYTADETRWMVVTNRMRDFRIYDLEDIRNPLPLVKDGFQKSNLSSTVWPLYSENPALALDDDFIEDACTVFTRSVMNVNYKTKSHIHSPSGVKTLCFTPWHNALIAGCENGDIILQKLKTLSMETYNANSFPRKYIFFTDIVKLDGQPVPLIKSIQRKGAMDSEKVQIFDSFEYQYNDTYGLIFGGPATCSRNERSTFMSMNRVTPYSLRPLTRVNCIALCSNVPQKDIAAIGYNNGLIRIKDLRFSDFL